MRLVLAPKVAVVVQATAVAEEGATAAGADKVVAEEVTAVAEEGEGAVDEDQSVKVWIQRLEPCY